MEDVQVSQHGSGMPTQLPALICVMPLGRHSLGPSLHPQMGDWGGKEAMASSGAMVTDVPCQESVGEYFYPLGVSVLHVRAICHTVTSGRARKSRHENL